MKSFFLILRFVLAGILCFGWLPSTLSAQTASTGALTGTVSDASGAIVPGTQITLTSESTGATRTVESGADGVYVVPLLPPGSYVVEASRAGFRVARYQRIRINVTETAALNIRLQVGEVSQTVTVEAEASQLQTSSSALGRVTDQRMVESLPLVTRNYTQILGLSPGVSSNVTDASAIGRGGSSVTNGPGSSSVAGGNTNDNNFQMNGAQVNDLLGSGDLTGGVPVPNPDSIQEYKVQTGQYDASYGRNAGANVDVVTKSGTNEFHGDVWEYFRNSVLNANDFFLNSSGQSRGVLDQNQFGFTFGGPVRKEKDFFFGSYQGTRERDGLGSGCLATGTLPQGLTNSASSRSTAGLGSEFGGQAGLLGGTVASDGSNISPTALAVLNAQLSSGVFVVPAPQNAATGQSTFSTPCTYNDDQVVADVDLYQSQASHLSGKFFIMNSNQATTLPGNQLGQPAVTVPGFSQNIPNGFRDFSLTHTYTFSSRLLNQAVLGFHRLSSGLVQVYPGVKFANTAACAGSTSGPFTLSSICVPAPIADNPFPDIIVDGAFNAGGNGQGTSIIAQNFYNFGDTVTYLWGKHSMHFGGGIDRSQINFEGFHFFGGLLYPSFPDFLLGNVLVSVDVPGLFDRAWRVWDGDMYAQDDYRVSPRLTLNLGFRYERQGAISDALGRASTFNPALANPNPPASGTLQGFVVASNFSGGTIPAGVTKASTNTAINNDNQNVWEPRLGFAYQLPGFSRMVLRGGYGIYAARITGQPFLQLIAAPPWGTIREFVLPGSVSAALPPAPAFPVFTPYSPTTNLTPIAFSPTFRPPLVQQYSMNLQTQLAANWMFEVGYQGARGTHLNLSRSFNQALSASPSNPIRGQTSNTLANIRLRVPIEGFSPSGATLFDSIGASWYNALDASLTKRFSNGLQFLASYTWASALENAPIFVAGANGGALIGDQNNLRANYGFDGFIRPQRLILSYLYDLPAPVRRNSLPGRFLAGWSVAGVTTFQSGQRLTLTDTDLLNAFGITTSGFGDGDRVQIASGCTYGNLVTSGSVNSRLNKYFNAACLTAPPVIGSDGKAAAFGNSGNGIARGPDQRNFDIALIKRTSLGRNEQRNIEFRSEFFNAFNTPSFSNPVTGGSAVVQNPSTGAPLFVPSPTLGQIQSTSVNPRIIQLALKVNF